MNATHLVDDRANAYQLLLVRVGTMGHIGKFHRGDFSDAKRGDSVVCRSKRGLERGVVLGPTATPWEQTPEDPTSPLDPSAATRQPDGRILRRFTPEDHLLWEHLSQLSSEAQQACAQWLEDQQIATTLVEVEPLLDGKTLYFHFLADVPAEVQAHMEALVRVYERNVRSSKFARLLEEGCGPGCGTTEKAGGCGTSSGSCAICSIAKHCRPTGDRG
jgi:hypothetical protein